MKKKNNEIMKWVNMVAFAVLLIGGLSFLLMGLFDFNMVGTIFGSSIVARVFYSVFGVAAIVLLATVLWKAFMGEKKPVVKVVSSKPSATSQAK